MKPTFRSRRSVALVIDPDERQTVQADADRVSITSIVARAKRNGGVVGSVPVRHGTFSDISSAPSFMDALNVVAKATSMFEALPSRLRDRFGNDPAQLLAFLDDEENRDEAIKLGIVKKPEEPPAPPEPMAVRVVKDDNAT